MSEQNKTAMRKCYECDGTMEGRRENYRYIESGLTSVVLMNILVYHCKCGAIVPEIPAVGMLHHAIGRHLLGKRSALTGAEVRFLRKMSEYSVTKLAQIMGVHKETVSRWENGKQNIGKESDRFLRFVCLDAIARGAARRDEEFLNEVREFSAINLPDIIQNIEELEAAENIASQTIKIDPQLLGRFGQATDESVVH